MVRGVVGIERAVKLMYLCRGYWFLNCFVLTVDSYTISQVSLVNYCDILLITLFCNLVLGPALGQVEVPLAFVLPFLLF